MHCRLHHQATHHPLSDQYKCALIHCTHPNITGLGHPHHQDRRRGVQRHARCIRGPWRAHLQRCWCQRSGELPLHEGLVTGRRPHILLLSNPNEDANAVQCTVNNSCMKLCDVGLTPRSSDQSSIDNRTFNVCTCCNLQAFSLYR